jgi:hypothetical protein
VAENSVSVAEMIEVITETLQDQIAAHDYDAPTRERLAACLPMLEQAIADWQANHAFSAPGLMIAAATPHSGVVAPAILIWRRLRWPRRLKCRARRIPRAS